jgi:hypothetical protein
MCQVFCRASVVTPRPFEFRSVGQVLQVPRSLSGVGLEDLFHHCHAGERRLNCVLRHDLKRSEARAVLDRVQLEMTSSNSI